MRHLATVHARILWIKFLTEREKCSPSLTFAFLSKSTYYAWMGDRGVRFGYMGKTCATLASYEGQINKVTDLLVQSVCVILNDSIQRTSIFNYSYPHKADDLYWGVITMEQLVLAILKKNYYFITNTLCNLITSSHLFQVMQQDLNLEEVAMCGMFLLTNWKTCRNLWNFLIY